MPLDPKKLDKPFVKLRKIVRKLSKEPTQDEVHDIRTNTRRVEAVLGALQLDRKQKGRRVLRAITPIRKKAGNVRDMDVLTGFAAALAPDGHDQCLTSLLEHLGAERARYARKLQNSVAKRLPGASKSLKNCAAFIQKSFVQKSSIQKKAGKKTARNSSKRPTTQQTEWPANATAAALRVSEQLANWPRLSTGNLHPFRLKVKEMRYVLQLSGEDNELTDRLGEVKDQIGEWHDWTELETLASEALPDCRNCAVIAQIKQMAKKRLDTAQRSAQQLRSKYFAAEAGSEKGRRTKMAIKGPVLQATAELAA